MMLKLWCPRHIAARPLPASGVSPVRRLRLSVEGALLWNHVLDDLPTGNVVVRLSVLLCFGCNLSCLVLVSHSGSPLFCVFLLKPCGGWVQALILASGPMSGRHWFSTAQASCAYLRPARAENSLNKNRTAFCGAVRSSFLVLWCGGDFELQHFSSCEQR
jgi:hypothetical protein